VTSPGELIRQAREARGWSQDELRLAIGVSQQTVSRWENRVYPVRAKYVAPLVRELGVDEEELLAAVNARTEEHDDSAGSAPDELLASLEELRSALAALDAKMERLVETVAHLTDRLLGPPADSTTRGDDAA
jgi:transcriptional regulator with XRE-family HTH domain